MDFRLYSRNSRLYEEMLRDIREAGEYVFLETFIFRDDDVGRRFRDQLTLKAQKGVKVRLLLDGFGSRRLPVDYFAALGAAGGEIRYFHRLKHAPRLLGKVNYRDHQKIMVVDGRVAFVNSANIEEDSTQWRELSIRLADPMEAEALEQVFVENFALANQGEYNRLKAEKTILAGRFEIIRDVPAQRLERVRSRTLELIRAARTEVLFETLYLITDKAVLKEMADAAARGVRVRVILPPEAEIRAVDIANQKYMARACRQGIDVRCYAPGYLHSKLMIVDREVSMLGSANLDYRSLFSQFELMLVSRDKAILQGVLKHYRHTVAESRPFDYRNWKRRPLAHKMAEILIAPLEAFL